MRMRKKPNLIPRMERCESVQIKNPRDLRGKWHELLPDCKKVFIELGCGKGKFITETAMNDPDTLYVAVERIPDAMVVGMERVFDVGIKNVLFIDMDVAKLNEVFAPGEADRIYINFCDPWRKKAHAKRRLTAPGFLKLYEEVLSSEGEIHFKTDNVPLFEFSLESFSECGYTLNDVTNDLHKNGINGVMTDYEKKFHEQGVKINRCVAKPSKKAKTDINSPEDKE